MWPGSIAFIFSIVSCMYFLSSLICLCSFGLNSKSSNCSLRSAAILCAVLIRAASCCLFIFSIRASSSKSLIPSPLVSGVPVICSSNRSLLVRDLSFSIVKVWNDAQKATDNARVSYFFICFIRVLSFFIKSDITYTYETIKSRFNLSMNYESLRSLISLLHYHKLIVQEHFDTVATHNQCVHGRVLHQCLLHVR